MEACSFNTLEQFLYLYKCTLYGKISSVFTSVSTSTFKYFSKLNATEEKESEVSQIDAVCWFKNSIKPEWEDEHNSKNGELQLDLKVNYIDKLDDIY